MTEQNFTIEELQNETWKPVVGYEGRYNVSNLGRIKRIVDRTSKHRNERILKTFYNKCGYERVGLTDNTNTQIKFYVHRLVAAAFIGACPKGFEVNHKAHPKSNNRVGNLEYATPKANKWHALQNGFYPSGERHHYARRPETIRKGENHPYSKLTEKDVLEIREQLEKKVPQKQLAKRYGVTKTTIYGIKYRKTWSHI